MDTASFRLPSSLVVEVARVARRLGTTRSQVVREALERFVQAQTSGRQRTRLESIDDALGDLPGTGVGDLASRGKHYLREHFGAKRRSRR